MSWNDGLSGSALQIASSNDSPLRVVAGPGTGKTFALKRRIARFLEEGRDPGRILVVTFTRMAARDLEKEISELEIPGVDRVYKGTLHSLCMFLLNEGNIPQIIGRKSRLIMEFESRFLLEDLGENQPNDFREDLHNRKRRLLAFEAVWAREQDQNPGWPNDDLDRNFQGRLFEWLIFHEGMLVGELIPITLRYLRENPASQVLRKFDNVLVDEYQDLNKAEQHLIDLLSSHASLTIVGDEDQSIYEDFRFAHPEGISNFKLDHPTTSDIQLSVCRRCPTKIVEMANELIKNNLRRLHHPLLPKEGNNPGDIHIVQWDTMGHEIEGIANYLAYKTKIGDFDPGKTIVLCPRKYYGYSIRDAIRQKGCSAHSFFQEEILDGNPKLLNNSEAQQAFSLLTLITRPSDLIALRCWLGYGSQNLRSGEYLRLLDYCSHSSHSIFETLELLITGELSIRYIAGIVDRYRALKEYEHRFVGMNYQAKFDEIFPAGQSWSEPFRQLVEDNDVDSLDAILNLLQINIIQPEMPAEVDYIRIMSLHKSKGLNADHVVVLGCVEGLLPKQADPLLPFEDRRRYIEEQRRLFYVAVTRSRKTLILSSCLQIPRNLAYQMGAEVIGGDEVYGNTIASTYLTELGPDRPKPISGNDWLTTQIPG